MARRTRTPFSATEIAEKVGRVKNHFPVVKHFRTGFTDGFFRYERRSEAIIREAQLDGFYLLQTSKGAYRLGAAEVMRRYMDLTRVRAHLFCCACWPITSTGIYGKPWCRCCPMTRSWKQNENGETRCWRPSRRNPPNGRRGAGWQNHHGGDG